MSAGEERLFVASGWANSGAGEIVLFGGTVFGLSTKEASARLEEQARAQFPNSGRWTCGAAEVASDTIAQAAGVPALNATIEDLRKDLTEARSARDTLEADDNRHFGTLCREITDLRTALAAVTAERDAATAEAQSLLFDLRGLVGQQPKTPDGEKERG